MIKIAESILVVLKIGSVKIWLFAISKEYGVEVEDIILM